MKINYSKYQLRDCAPNLLHENQQAEVKRKYRNGFDLFVSAAVIYFTPFINRMNPYSVLAPENVVRSIEENDKIRIGNGSIFINNFELCRGNDIASPELQKDIDFQTFESNLKLLGSNLRLFGRGQYAQAVDYKNQQLKCSDAELFAFEKFTNFDWEAINKKPGTGEGLTPSFDDLLSGIIFADRFSRFNSVEVPAQFLKSLSNKTTIQSCQQLQAAIKGKLNIGFEKLLASMFCEKIKSAEIVKIMNYGHTSGADILSGVWFYLTNKVKIIRNN